MSEVSFEQLLDEVSFKPLRTGEVVTGRVIDVKADEIILSIDGSKSEGIITKSEYSNDSSVDLTTKVQVGDEMEAKVNIAGFLVLIALMLYVTWNDIVRFIAPLFGG